VYNGYAQTGNTLLIQGDGYLDKYVQEFLGSDITTMITVKRDPVTRRVTKLSYNYDETYTDIIKKHLLSRVWTHNNRVEYGTANALINGVS
jgi:hypothetical protein